MVGFEYDPENRLQHTSFWVEEDLDKEWPKSANATTLKYPQGESLDPKAKPDKFFFSVEVIS